MGSPRGPAAAAGRSSTRGAPARCPERNPSTRRHRRSGLKRPPRTPMVPLSPAGGVETGLGAARGARRGVDISKKRNSARQSGSSGKVTQRIRGGSLVPRLDPRSHPASFGVLLKANNCLSQKASPGERHGCCAKTAPPGASSAPRESCGSRSAAAASKSSNALGLSEDLSAPGRHRRRRGVLRVLQGCDTNG